MDRAVGGGDSRRRDHRNARKSWWPHGKDGGDDACELESKMAIPAGLEPACRLIRNQVLVRLSYGIVGVAGETRLHIGLRFRSQSASG